MEIKTSVPVSKEQARMYAPLTLAYLGDGVYELLVRAHLTSRGSLPVKKLHKLAKQFVSADAQSRFCDALAEVFLPEEADIFRRGRNAKPHTTAKNMSIADYMKATGLEAVFGYLYLIGDGTRIHFLFSKITQEMEMLQNEGASPG